ncbi:MAG: type II toxin-antitoxin system RelE/ParE family toxin [Chloroherpetonaceae bacterium]|nr:type II toxin-antitoxin system RelE/ParE family toxin [Chloroherpetonaceae bacterium]
MKSGYNVVWTDNAVEELSKTIKYLQENFTEKEIQRLAQKVDRVIDLISRNPLVFPKSKVKPIHRFVILKYNTMYYQVSDDRIEILSFFSNRQSPEKNPFEE